MIQTTTNFIRRCVKSVSSILTNEYRSHKICNIASSYMYQLLTDNGLNPRIVLGTYSNEDYTRYFHCWVKLDETIIDCTNVQFRTDLPCIFNANDDLYLKHYSEGVVFNIACCDIDGGLYKKIKDEIEG